MVAVQFWKEAGVAGQGKHEPELEGSTETFPFQKSEVPGPEGGLETGLPDRLYKNLNSYIQCDSNWYLLNKQAVLLQAHDPSPAWMKTSSLFRKG